MNVARARSGCHMLEESGKVVVAGGLIPRFKPVNTVEIYDISNESWTLLQDVPVDVRSFFSIGDRFAAMDTPNPTIHIFSPENNTWNALNHSPIAVPALSSGETVVAVLKDNLIQHCST